MKTILVIAFKYNDILYSLATEEYKSCDYRKLLIVYASGKNPDNFPCQNLFDEVLHIPYIDGTRNMPSNLYKIFSNRKFLKSDIITLSNPVLLVNKYIFKLSGATSAVWVEDGLMNYYLLKDISEGGNKALKRLVEYALRVVDIDKSAQKLATYLLEPSSAMSYWGTRHKITLDKDLVNKLPLDSMAFLENKKIFVGQPLYLSGKISIEQYNNEVNKLIAQESIDYYLPHFWASKEEKICCKSFSLDEYHVTLEFLACKYSFEVYSISSSLLYTTKLLNKNVKTHMVDINGLASKHSIIKDSINEIVKI